MDSEMLVITAHENQPFAKKTVFLTSKLLKIHYMYYDHSSRRI